MAHWLDPLISAKHLKGVHQMSAEDKVLGRRSSPDLRLDSRVEWCHRHTPRLINFPPIAEVLPSQNLPPKHPQPALDQVKPTCFGRNEDQGLLLMAP
jgi:hypothetical protein